MSISHILLILYSSIYTICVLQDIDFTIVKDSRPFYISLHSSHFLISKALEILGCRSEGSYGIRDHLMILHLKLLQNNNLD